jgi:hypothetical protein
MKTLPNGETHAFCFAIEVELASNEKVGLTIGIKILLIVSRCLR